MNTIGDVLRRATARLRAHSDSADHEARLMLTHVLDVSTTRLYSNPEVVMDTAAMARFDALVERRADGEPLAYIIGHCGFWTLELNITPAVLVPRADTETLVETALATLPQDTCRVVDLGTGSGAIALALASERPHWQLVATDTSTHALACARANAERLQLTQVRFLHGNWFAPLAGQRFDAIVSNPPYVAVGDPHLAAAELQHEPDMALTAGASGLIDLKHIVASASQHLLPAGWLLLEHGYDQGSAVRALLQQAGFHAISTQKDLGGRERVTCGRLGQESASSCL